MEFKHERHGDLEIDLDPSIQCSVWRWQRRAWALIGVTIVAALLGLFGDSPIQRGTVSDPLETLRVEFDRVGRRESEHELLIQVKPDAVGAVQLWLSRDYVEAAGIETIDPRPLRESAGPEGTTYTFACDPGGQVVSISFKLVPRGFGFLHARIRLGASAPLGFRQFIYP